MSTKRSRQLIWALLLAFSIGTFPSLAANSRWISKGQPGTRVTGLVMSTSNPGVLYLGAYGAGVSRSADAGETWKAINAGIDVNSIVSLAIDPSNPTTLYAGTEFGRMFMTTDGGDSWKGMPSCSAKAIATIAVPAERNTLYVLANASVFRTTNGGANWTESRLGLDGTVESLTTVRSIPSQLFVATSTGLFTTSNHGDSWRQVPIPGVRHVGAIAVSDDGRTIYANSGDFHTSIDGGMTWNTVAGHGLQDSGTMTIDRWSSSTAWATTSDPGDRTHSVYRTTDSGRSWSRLDFAEEIRALLLGGDTIHAATWSGLYKSTDDAEHWRPLPFGMNASPAYKVVLDADNASLMYAATPAGVFKTTNAGSEWTLSDDLKDARTVTIDPNSADVAYASSAASARKTTDGGATWTEIRPSPGKLAGARALAIDPAHSSTVYAVLVGDGLSKSLDGGSTFSLINSGLPWDFYYGFDSTTIAIAPSEPTTLYASSVGISRSTNGGDSWQKVTEGLPLYSASAIAVDPTQPAFVYAAAHWQPGIYRSSVGGVIWERLQIGLTTESFTDVIVDPSDGRNVYVATGEHGVYKSSDRGETWTPFSEGLPATPINSLAIDSTGRFLAAATAAGVFTVTSGDLVTLPPELHAERLDSDPARLKHLLEQVRSLSRRAPPASRARSSASAGLLFAVSGNATGALGTHFRSDVTLMNGGATPQSAIAVWLAAGSDGTDAPSVRVTLPPSAITITDFIQKMGFAGLGSLLIVGVDAGLNVDADADLTGFSRIWTAGPDGRGSVSQSLPAADVAFIGDTSAVSAIGLHMDGDFRTNVGIVNLDAIAHTFVLTLAGERKSTTLSLTVEPFSMRQVPLPEGDYGPLTALFQTTSDDFSWTAYGASVDNLTGDGWASQASPIRVASSAQPQLPPGSAGIAGTVYASTGACLPGAVVEVLDGARAGEKRTQTECGGYWDGLPPGYSISLPAGTKVRMRASMPGYRSKEEVFTVTTLSAAAESNFFLDPE